MGHYASFYDKQAPPPVIVHAGPVHTSEALPANMVLVLEDYYCPDTEDDTFSAPAIVKKGVQKAGKKPKARVNVPRLQQAVDQGLLDDDEELTPVEDMDELEDIPVPTKIQHQFPKNKSKFFNAPVPMTLLLRGQPKLAKYKSLCSLKGQGRMILLEGWLVGQGLMLRRFLTCQ